MAATDTAPLSIRLELEERASEWKAHYIVASDSFPQGKYEARVPVPDTFNSREDAVQHSIRQLGQLIAEQVGSQAQMRG